MVSQITGCGRAGGEHIDIEPVEYERDECQYQLVKRIAELEADRDMLICEYLRPRWGVDIPFTQTQIKELIYGRFPDPKDYYAWRKALK